MQVATRQFPKLGALHELWEWSKLLGGKNPLLYSRPQLREQNHFADG
jgi:hypothetical protein